MLSSASSAPLRWGLLVSLSTLSLNHLESWLYGMVELREAALCGAAGAGALPRVGAI